MINGKAVRREFIWGSIRIDASPVERFPVSVLWGFVHSQTAWEGWDLN